MSPRIPSAPDCAASRSSGGFLRLATAFSRMDPTARSSAVCATIGDDKQWLLLPAPTMPASVFPPTLAASATAEDSPTLAASATAASATGLCLQGQGGAGFVCG